MKEAKTETLNRRWTQICADKMGFRRGIDLRQSAFICGWVVSFLVIFASISRQFAVHFLSLL